MLTANARTLQKTLVALMVAFVCLSSARAEAEKHSFWSDSGLTVVSARITTPQLFSVAVGYTYEKYDKEFFEHRTTIFIEPGVSGVKVGVDYANFIALFLCIGAKVGFLQTYGKPVGGVEPGQTYAGGEIIVGFALVTLNAGVYTHLAGDRAADDWIFSGGIGIGF